MAGPEGTTVTATVGGRELTLNTGKIAKQSSGAVWVRYGDTVVLMNANAAPEAREGMNFLPLTVNYEEKISAGGRIPGSFFRREGRPTEKETLTSRIVDRAIRPLFTEGWRFETQVIANVLSFDQENDADSLALTGASAALMISDIPFAGPIAGVRVGRVDGELVVNPTVSQRETSELDIFIAASREAIVMVEGGADEVGEEIMVEALELGKQACQPLIDAQLELVKAAGKAKREFQTHTVDPAIIEAVRAYGWPKIEAAYANHEKLERYAALSVAKNETMAHFSAELGEETWAAQGADYKEAFGKAKSEYARTMIVKDRIRIGGRKPDEIRSIWSEVSVLPRTHGSAIFTRGETQAVVTCTLGTGDDEQRIETLSGMTFKKFMLHYNFPPYSVGEVKRVGSPGRREIGHGALAERAIRKMLPGDEFPYTLRIVSDITESNGSSSMASVCGGTLSLMDAGVPMKAPVAGIAMGLIMEGDDYVVLSDILGDEDHLGDMDFKVCGTEKGITAIQMDIKCPGLTQQIMSEALNQARAGRLHILGEMAKALPAPRTELSPFAPRIVTIKVKTERIKDVIGPGGKMIRDIVKRTGTSINIEDDGSINIASPNLENVEAAIKIIREITAEPEINKVYTGTVRRIMDFGAFVEILPGTDGLVHISEIADKRIERVTDVLNEGDEVLVKVLSIDRQGKIRLSRKAALAEGSQSEEEKKEAEGGAD